MGQYINFFFHVVNYMTEVELQCNLTYRKC